MSTLSQDQLQPQKPDNGTSHADTAKRPYNLIRVWTDDSCDRNPGCGGWAFIAQRIMNEEVIGSEELSGFGPQETTNNRIGMEAVVEALNHIPQNEATPISLYSDNQNIINAMNGGALVWIAKGWKKSDGKPVMHRDLWEQMLELSEGLNITWSKVQGHASNTQNKRVKALAQAAGPSRRLPPGPANAT